jgi:outer membrane protein assembly factor BamB
MKKAMPILVVILCAALTQVCAIDELQVKWTFNTSDQFEGKVFGSNFQAGITVFDIDADGSNEIIFGTRTGDSRRIWCTDHAGNLEWVFPPIVDPGYPGNPQTKISIVDVDSDGDYEIAVAGRGAKLHLLEPDGSLIWLWENPNGRSMRGAPQAYDVDGDGYIEFFLNDDGGQIWRVTHEGKMVWQSAPVGGGNRCHPTIADINRDGEYDILVASQDHSLYCLQSSNGEEDWRLDTGARMQANTVIVADVDDDGEYEAIVWNDEPVNSIFVVSFFGTEIGRWTAPTPGSIQLCQAMGDIDGDGSFEMAVMSDGGLYLLSFTGSKLSMDWELNLTRWIEDGVLPPGAIPNRISSYQLIADINGDDKQEILWLAPYPIVSDAATGEPIAYYTNEHLRLKANQESGSWWGDVDNDGVSEWLVELKGNTDAESQLYCLTMNGKFPADSPWPEYFHSAYPAEYQNDQSWLTLKAAYSNGLWFPMPEVLVWSFLIVFGASIVRKA